MLKLNIKRLISLFVIMMSFVLVGNEKTNVSMEQKLKNLNYRFDSDNKDFFIIKGGTNKVIVSKNPERDPETNKVYHLVFTLWEPFFLDSEEIKTLNNINKKLKYGSYGICESGNRKSIYFGFDFPVNVTTKDLSKAIAACATAKMPIKIDMNKQYRLSIIEVLDKDQKAGRSNKGHKEIARMMANIDLSYCPSDFKEAYRKHTDAWAQERLGATEVGAVLGAADGDPLTALVGGILGAVIDTAVQGSDIRSTFEDVLRIAREYGVNTESYK